MCVEQIGNEGKVKLGISGHERSRCQEFAAVEGVGVLEDLFGTLVEIAGLEWCAGADVWFELVEEDCVILAIFDVGGEVGNTNFRFSQY